MKTNIIRFSVAISILATLSCAKNNANKNMKQDINARVEELTQKHGNSTATIKEIGNAGGQPANIILLGQGLVDTEGKSLSDKVSLSSRAGLRCDTKQPDEVKVSHLSDVSLNAKLEKFNITENTFVNLGCADTIDKSVVEGFTDITESELKLYKENGKILLIKASKIFICGDKNIENVISFSLKADEIYLNNIIMKTDKANAFLLNVETNKLILVGSNSIESNIEASLMPSVMPVTAQLKFSVTEGVSGDGKLSIDARGSDCVK